MQRWWCRRALASGRKVPVPVCMADDPAVGSLATASGQDGRARHGDPARGPLRSPGVAFHPPGACADQTRPDQSGPLTPSPCAGDSVAGSPGSARVTRAPTRAQSPDDDDDKNINNPGPHQR